MPGNKRGARKLARSIPNLAAAHVNIEGAPRHEGGVTAAEMIVRLQKGSKRDINAPDINVHIRAHNFPARVKDGQQRTERLHDAFREHLDNNEHKQASLSVELELADLGYKASYPGERP